MKVNYILIILTVLLFSVCYRSISQVQHSDTDEMVEQLLSKMTLEEKIGQMNLYSGFWDITGPPPEEGAAAKKYEHLRSGMVGGMLNVRSVKDIKPLQQLVVEESRLGIPLIFGFDVIHGFKTLSPIPLAESASWDLEAIEASARVAATEAAAAGINWTFAPMMDISRDARWGRVMEGGGEDPYLGSKIAAARVKGFQGDDLGRPNTIAACAKHFAGYGFAVGGRDYNTVDMSINQLHNIVFPPFKAAVNAGVATVMNSFNDLNGVPANGSAYLQRDILKGQWGFKGFVVSDWGTIKEMVVHGYAKDLKDAAQKGANTGSDMDMEGYGYINHLKELVEEGKVPISVIDDAARRILTVKKELGLFDDPYRYCDEEREKEVVYADEWRVAVRNMAERSIVLLKNENNILPLKKSGQKIAVIGPLADDDNSPLGSWRLASDDHTAVTLLDGLKKYTGNEYEYQQGVKLINGPAAFIHEVDINESDDSGIEEAKEMASSVDVVILAVGEHGFQSGEARSRTQLDLPGLQQKLLEEIYSVNKNIVLVLMNGRPLVLNWADEHIPAIVEAWQLGSEAGNAIASVLMGDYNPSGKLPMSFPRSVGQVPLYYNHNSTGRPTTDERDAGLVFWSHYIDEENTPLYPFGYGLSYTSFAYDNLQVTPITGGAKVSLSVTNTGDVAGEEVVQLYIRDKVASLVRPVKELKGFDKIMLGPGESKTVSFTLGHEELGFYDNEGNYRVEPGEFDIMVGGNSRDLLHSNFILK